MREMIISELTQAVHDLARGFAHFLPRLIVMLILAFVGWLIAYVVKVTSAQHSPAHQVRPPVRECRRFSTAYQGRAPFGHRGVEPVRLLAHLAWLHPAGGERPGNPGPAGANREIFPVPSAPVRGGADLVLRYACGRLFCSRCSAGGSECKCSFPTPAEPCCPQHDYGFRIVDRL